MAAPKKDIDWEGVELHYRAGLRTLKDIGSEYGVSDAAIIKRAKRDGWERDLKAKIQAKAEAKVSASLVSAEVSKEARANERVVIEAAATAIARVKLEHRARISRHVELLDKLHGELEQETGELSSRVDLAKKISDTLKTLIGLERDAFDIVTPTKVDHMSSDGSMTPKGRTLDDFYRSADVPAKS